MFLVDDLLFMPIDGIKFVFRTIMKTAEEQYLDDAPLKEQLLELEMRFDNGEVTEEEYSEEQAAILRALREVQHRKMEMAGVDPATQTGPLGGKVGEGSGVDVHLDYGPSSKK
ncbi:MAG: gas vesicle protein GvpG [Candidatus Koribacter versatilis]|uniref:Gas vesicle protein GvpG n=1 Tax=Candidatus Korobacter versatilis TaxID=658062 RepID=A0A932A5S4_9BACT|nr:gas vesicle protein GvpG [Candidatus Koribacter versatilis]